MAHEKTFEEMDRDDRVDAYNVKRRKALASLRSLRGPNADALTLSELVDLRLEGLKLHLKKRGQ
jgi:hypothetical protein